MRVCVGTQSIADFERCQENVTDRASTVSIGQRILCLGLLVTLLASCRMTPTPAPRQVSIQQTWELEPGDFIGPYRVVASLGDISIELKGQTLRAPFSGEVEPTDTGVNCIYFSTPEIPAYLFRFCGLRHPRLGSVTQGEAIGSSEYFYFATLRRQPEGTWAIVEPSRNVLERALQAP